MALSSPDVEMGGPRGAVRGEAALREWMERANVRLEPGRIFHGAEKVVVEQEARWGDAGTGETPEAKTVATTFVVRDGLVSSVVRHDGDEALADALRAAGLDETHRA